MTHQSSTKTTWVAILIAFLPVVYLSLIWNDLPQTVPVHFGPDMQPDRHGNKSNLWLMTGILSAVSIATYFMLTNLHRIDPKRKGAGQSSRFRKLAFGMVFFLAAVNILILISAKGSMSIQRFLFPLMGLLLAFIGNNMHTIKPNYFAGIRLPWTLNNDENWRKTHQLAGKLWFAGGLLFVAISFFIPQMVVFPLFISMVMILILVPVVYSYSLFRQQV